ncbi:MAG: glycosyltransferase [Bacteroidia bacterium]|nr:MAG: glycosyltransferase [Bacteroidia bacterium]
MKNTQIKYSFVVPVFNEEANIRNLYRRLLEINAKHAESWELIFVNDGSVDGSRQILEDLCRIDNHVKYIELSRNFGHQAALSAGLKYAVGQAVISMDCDLQDPPEVIVEMMQKWQQGYKIVYARRLNYRKDNWLKKVGSKLFYRVLGRFSKVDIPSNVGDFRLVDQLVLREINRMPEHSRYLRGMVAWTGFSHTFVDYQRPDRTAGESGYSLRKLAKLGMDGVVNFSMFPLRLALYLGLLSILSGMGLFLYQLLDVLINGVYYHLYKWLIVIIYIFIGFMFMLFWIVGEYIGKIYDEVRKRPVFIINKMTNFDQ